MAQDGPILEFQNVNLKYGDNWGLRDVSLSLSPGQTHVFFGSAGAGKTTLLKAVIGLVKIDTGTIRLFGEDVSNCAERDFFRLRSRTGFLFQEGGLFDSLPIGDNVEYPLANQQTADGSIDQGTDYESRVREALCFVELEQTFDKFPSELSGGMRRRVGIARAIVTKPPLVLYDSPTAGLDPITANTIMALVAKQRDTDNTASLIVTHRYQDGEIMAKFRYDNEHGELIPLTDEERAANRTNFIVMKDGAIVFSGSHQQLEASTDSYVRRFIGHEY